MPEKKVNATNLYNGCIRPIILEIKKAALDEPGFFERRGFAARRKHMFR